MGYGQYMMMTKDQQDIVAIVHDFMEKEVAPIVAEADKKGECPLDLVKKMATELGLTGFNMPEKYGGLGFDHTTCALISEEMSKYDAGFAITFGSGSFGFHVVEMFGTEEQKLDLAARIMRNEHVGMAITESQSGSDVASTKTRAVKTDKGWLVNGTKTFITNAPIMTATTILAVTDPEEGTRGMSVFIVDMKLPGVSVGKKEDKFGIRLSPTADVIFEDVLLPFDALVGEEGKGFKQIMQTLDVTRASAAAPCIGIGQRALDLAVAYAKERKFKDIPIASKQGIQFMLADMEIKMQTARAILYYNTAMSDRGIPLGPVANCSKTYCSEVVFEVCNMAIQIFGGYGYSREYPVESSFATREYFQFSKAQTRSSVR